jgi:hypothetical protein
MTSTRASVAAIRAEPVALHCQLVTAGLVVWTAGNLSQRIPGEDVARTVHVTRQLGEPLLIAPEDSDALFERYQNVYGQR